MKTAPGILVCLLFAVFVFSQTEVMRCAAQETTTSAEAAKIETTIQSFADNADCGCLPASYETTQPNLGQPCSSWVFSGNSFSTIPMRQHRSITGFHMPPQILGTDGTQPNSGNSYGISANRRFIDVTRKTRESGRRGWFFQRFRR